jgi:hypothetical protein
MTATQNVDIQMTKSQNVNIQMTATQNIDIQMTKSQNVDIQMTKSQNVKIQMTKTQNVDIQITKSQNVDINITKSQNVDIKITESQNVDPISNNGPCKKCYRFQISLGVLLKHSCLNLSWDKRKINQRTYIFTYSLSNESSSQMVCFSTVVYLYNFLRVLSK